MKKYLLSVCYPAGSKQPGPAALEKIMRDVGVVQQEMQAAGAWVFGGGLDASIAARVVRHKGGKLATTDGPFIESKELIGGITIVQAPDLDAALEWGRKLALATTTPIEVRAFF